MRAAAASLALLLLAGNSHAQTAPDTPPGLDVQRWLVTMTQIAQTGRTMGAPVSISCDRTGCESRISLTIADTPQPFLASFTFVQRGAYLALRALTAGPGRIIGFQDGYEGPIFLQVRRAETVQTLDFTLTGTATTPTQQEATPLMNNQQSLVFHRKLDPDLILRVQIKRPGT